MRRFKLFLLIISIWSVLFVVLLFGSCISQGEDKNNTPITEPTTYEIIYSASKGGYIDGTVKQTIEQGKDAQLVVAVPNDGYKFVKWSDGITAPERQDKNISGNKTLIAEFEIIQVREYTVLYETTNGGYINGMTEQIIEDGKNTQAVTAIPNEGYNFVKWSDGVTSAQRQDNDIRRNQTLTAIFEKKIFTVTYLCNDGMMSMWTKDGKGYGGPYINFEVKYGDDCIKIITVNLEIENFIFVGWSDGVETMERQELNVTSDITVTAIFGFEITYKVDENKGGRVIGNCRQKIEKGKDSDPVEAIADEGYVFSGWSDLSMDTMHSVNQIEKSLEYVAYFEPIAKTFNYDYGAQMPLKSQITLNRYEYKDAQFEIPEREGYTFCGWYADDKYTVKVVHESGKLMLGLQTLNLDTDTLYAKWKKIGEEIKTYKILMVMTDEVNVPFLYSYESNRNISVDYKMSGIERKICPLIKNELSFYLNKWFKGEVIFEIDIYFTQEVVTKFDISMGLLSGGQKFYSIMCPDMKEMKEMQNIVDEYDCTMTTYSFGDYNFELCDWNASARAKHLEKNFESFLSNTQSNHHIVEALQNFNPDGELDKFTTDIHIMGSYLHEFCHTIEARYRDSKVNPEFSKYQEEVFPFHDWERLTISNSDLNLHPNMIEPKRLYLTCEAVLEGINIGIPPSYWEDYINKE